MGWKGLQPEVFKSGSLCAYSHGSLYLGDNGTKEECQWEVIPIDNGEFVYFKNRENQRILDSNNLSSGFLWISNEDWSVPHAYDHYSGKDYHKWRLIDPIYLLP